MLKNIIHPLFLLLIISSFFSCKKNYLSYSTNEGTYYSQQVWYSDRNTRSFLNDTYNGLSTPTSTASTKSLASRYNIDGSGGMLSEGSDEAISSNPSSTMYNFLNGGWGSTTLIDDNYSVLYNYIRRTNMFLANVGTSSVYPATDTVELKSEAFFLRAFFYFELLKRYGGVAIITKVLAPTDNLNLPRNTYNEVVTQIIKDCDSAFVGLPLWNGVQGNTYDSLTWDDGARGRATRTAALALKCRTLLYAASPLNNPSNDLLKWQVAADVAKQIIQYNVHGLLASTDYSTYWDYDVSSLAYNKEVIFATSALQTNAIDQHNAPIGYSTANGLCNPTQDLVDAFETTKGYPINDSRSGYNPQNPYFRRDPRLGYFIICNGSSFKGRSVQTFQGGLDNVATNLNSTKTGYYLRKFLSESATWNTTTNVSRRRPWIIFRYAEILLNYAEALNEAQGPVQGVYDAINTLRTRVQLPALPTGITQDSMRIRIQNERRVELCFEDHRFFDVRRWKQGNIYMNGNIMGMNIVKTGSVLTYTPVPVGTRIWNDRNYLYPFDQAEIYKNPNLIQNPGY